MSGRKKVKKNRRYYEEQLKEVETRNLLKNVMSVELEKPNVILIKQVKNEFKKT